MKKVINYVYKQGGGMECSFQGKSDHHASFLIGEQAVKEEGSQLEERDSFGCSIFSSCDHPTNLLLPQQLIENS